MESATDQKNSAVHVFLTASISVTPYPYLQKKKGKFDSILIETTGLADPAPVAQTFFVHDKIRVSSQPIAFLRFCLPNLASLPACPHLLLICAYAKSCICLLYFYIMIKEKTRLDAILTVVDAKHLIQHLDDPRPEVSKKQCEELRMDRH